MNQIFRIKKRNRRINLVKSDGPEYPEERCSESKPVSVADVGEGHHGLHPGVQD